MQPALGGLLLGLILLFDQRVMGVGYEYVNQALSGRLVLQTMLLLGALKLIATIISYSSGNAGGIFAPSLFIGAMLGGAMGTLVQNFGLFDTPTAGPGAYALVGMGTLFAGIIRAPMTSVFMILELTQDYEIVVPLMIANMISLVISRRYQRVPVYHALLRQDDVHLPAPGERVQVGRWRAGEMMSREIRGLPLDSSLDAAWKLVETWPGECFPVREGEQLVGLVTREGLEKAWAEGDPSQPLAPLVARDGWAHAHPDQPLELALERLSQTPGLLPVVSRSDVRRLEGVITLEDVLRAFHYTRRF